MESSIWPLFPITLIVPLIMSGLALLKYLENRKNEFKHLSEFFLSLALVTGTGQFLWALGPAYIIMSMFPWIWLLRTSGLICEDIARVRIFSRYHYYVLGIGGFATLMLLLLRFSLPVIVAPFSFSIGFIGLTFFFQAYQLQARKNYSSLHHFNLGLLLSFFMLRLTFSLWIGQAGGAETGALVDSYLLLMVCSTMFPLYAKNIFEQREKFLENVLLMRNKQLFSHSGFSEFKILSAGVTHEVNNALTKINLKIEQILRGSSRDTDKDLRMILNNSNRIVKSMRGLREFIYPQDISEVLDLGQLIREVLLLYGQRLINHAVEVKTEGLDGKHVKGHRIQLEQIFLSFINNSVDAVDLLEEKWIKISGYSRGNVVDIIVQDSSHTHQDDVMTLLDDPYSTVEDVKDNVIRLVINKDIIEKHGGTLKCQSTPEGSRFVVTLPMAEPLYEQDYHFEKTLESEFKELH